jgi:glycosyltransferase involved in cell wall biosynthesis
MSAQRRTCDQPPDRLDVSVVIPTHSRWPLLSTAALRGALAQEDVSSEVIVVDDGSIDETSVRLDELAASEPRLRVIRHEHALGVAHARNAGTGAARGDWIAFLDDDDLWAPRKLRLQIDAVESAHADFVYGGVAWVDEARRFLFALPPPDPADLATTLLRWNVMWGGCSNVVVRREILKKVGGFDERLFQLADWDLWIRLALAGTAAVCRDLVVGYVMQSQSMLLTHRRDVFTEFRYLAAKHEAAAAKHGARPDAALFARWVALGHLRAGRRGSAARTYLRGALRYGDVSSAARAAAALTGERGFALGRAIAATRRRVAKLDVDEPGWLELYR